MTESGIDPTKVQKQIVVQAGQETCWRVFTTRLQSWWPLAHYKIGKAKAVDAIIEPRVDGRWYERGEDGSTCEWGSVLVWEPNSRLVLSWDLAGGIGDLAHHISPTELLPLNVSRTLGVRLRPRIPQLTDRLPWCLIWAREEVTKTVVTVFSEKETAIVAVWFDAPGKSGIGQFRPPPWPLDRVDTVPDRVFREALEY